MQLIHLTFVNICGMLVLMIPEIIYLYICLGKLGEWRKL